MPDNTLRVEGTIFNRVHLQILGFMRNIDFLLKARLIRIKTEDKQEQKDVIEMLKNLNPDESHDTE